MKQSSQRALHNTKSYDSDKFTTITHPYHPLSGQRLEIVSINTQKGVITVKLSNGKPLRLPKDFTDYMSVILPGRRGVASDITHLHSVEALREIIWIINQRKSSE